MAFELSLPTPDSFLAFPYDPPYGIQVDLMRHLYASIEQGKVTIVESPTGTGKTLSLLCSSLTWLRDERDRARKGKMREAVGDVEAKDWVIEQTQERIRREMEAQDVEYEERLAGARKREESLRRMARARVTKKARRSEAGTDKSPPKDDDDAAFLPDDDTGQAEPDEPNISPALRALMAKVDGNTAALRGNNPFSSNAETEPSCTKIFYASRTHSQLSQILPELQRLKLVNQAQSFHPYRSIPNGTRKRAANLEEEEPEITASTRTVSLGSRKQLCINDALRARSKDLDESCRELLGEKGEKRCEFLPQMHEETGMLDFRDQILASPKDIEDLAEAGRMAHLCPYFGSRKAIPQAELVTLPYNLLLQKSAREALGINLEGHIVIVDEAHNLIPTLLSLSNTRITRNLLVTSLFQVRTYLSRFRTRLKGSHVLQLKRLVLFLDALQAYAIAWASERGVEVARKSNEKGGAAKPPAVKKDRMEVVTVAELVERLGRKVAGINLLEVEAYLKSSKIARKISGYSDKEAEKDKDPATLRKLRRGAIPPLNIVEAFLLSLTGTNDDGRVTLSIIGKPGSEDIELKYQLLNPAPNFLEVVNSARAVVLAGGTMSPISDVVNQLFTQLDADRVTSFSCGHIIPSSSLQTLVVGKGPRGGELEYKAGRQGEENVISELGQVLTNFANVVPAGMIVFFPSYNFLNTAKAFWVKSGVLERFGTKKKVFFEPEETTDVEKVLQEYSATIQAAANGTTKRGGALLFAVIGAKLSEGLNFADDLARAVIIIGLPFANLGSPELRERMRYVKRLEDQQRGGRREAGKKDAAVELYENMCMNAVNQSIGRAIRHRGDWASLILLDKRYATPSIRNKLPKWIGSGITITEGFGQAVKELGTFYSGKRG